MSCKMLQFSYLVWWECLLYSTFKVSHFYCHTFLQEVVLLLEALLQVPFCSIFHSFQCSHLNLLQEIKSVTSVPTHISFRGTGNKLQEQDLARDCCGSTVFCQAVSD